MIIKLTGVVDSKLGKTAAKEVQGEKVGSNESWKRSFFANNKELRDQLNEFEVGDYVKVLFVKDGQYYNISGFEDPSDEEIEKAMADAKKYGKGKEGVSSGGGSVRRADGGSRGDDTNRSAAIYLARDFILADKTVAASPYTTAESMAVRAAQIADTIIYPYIKDGVINTPEEDKPKTKRRATKEDVLAPPTVED